MFKNLRAEMAREGVTGKDIAKRIGIPEKTLYSRMNGKTEFKRSEMLKIQKELFPRSSLTYLFDMSDTLTA